MSERSKLLAANAAALGVGAGLTQVLSFVMVPVVAGHLSLAEFGTADLVVTTLSLLGPVVSFGMAEGVLRFALERDTDPRVVVSTAVAVGLPVPVLLALVSPLVSRVHVAAALAPMLAVLLLVQVIRDGAAQYVRARISMRIVAMAGVVQSVAQFLLVMTLLGRLDAGLPGYLLALTLSSGLGAAWLVIVLVRDARPGLTLASRSLAERMLRYSLPLIPNSLLWWATASAGKFVLAGSSGAREVGLYSAASRVPALLSLTTQIFMQAWQVSAVREIASATRRQFQDAVLGTLSLLLFATHSLVLAVLKPFVGWYLPAQYFESWKVVPPLLFGVGFLAFATFLGTEYKTRMNTSGFMWTSVFGAGASIAASAVLVVPFGAVGAGVGGALGFLTLWLVRVRRLGTGYSQRSQFRLDIACLLVLLSQSIALYVRMAMSTGLAMQVLCIAVVLGLQSSRVVRLVRHVGRVVAQRGA